MGAASFVDADDVLDFSEKNVTSSEATAGVKTAREGAGLRRSVADVCIKVAENVLSRKD